MINPLSDKQIRFCDEYLIDFNATQAAIRAGYSKKTARSIATENLTKPDIQNYLQSKKKAIADKMEISQERTMLEIARIGYSDIRRAFDKNGALKPIHEIDDATAAALSSIEIEEFAIGNEESGLVRRSKKVKSWDKNKSLDMLAKHFKIYADSPPVNNVFNISNLSAEDLKTLLALKKKVV